ncbi:uncharacterized protein LOC111384949 [Olea europaea var. sylvestris]|uniref:uncharacterized protein LOC111384949 n=1 Tax=Olea europaea var. sylvestris TaxID=158386 RepID=UPI000C1D7DA3|nr:uncharacterized protein LOC111384949 [Olea europaea var. sylvestris]
MHAPRASHLTAAHRVLRYLKGTSGHGIFFAASSGLQLTAYIDSDWASCPTTRRSTTGYFIQLGTNPISWRTKKQTIVAHSSAKAEYRAIAVTTCELIWLKTLLADLCISHSLAINLFCNNQSALRIAWNTIADIFTKALGHDLFHRFYRKLGITDLHAPT